MLERDAAPGVHRVERAFTNWYLVEDEACVTIVDAGLPTSWDDLLTALVGIGRRADEVRAVILTHAHFDHLGFAERARRELSVPVVVHTDDFPLTKQPRRYAFERPRSLYVATQFDALPIVASLVRNRAWWPRPIAAAQRLRAEDSRLPRRAKVVPTPGHTIGHVAFHLPDRDTVIAGDAVVTLDPYTGRRGPRLVARAATADSERALDSLNALAATGARTVLTGHGPPWRQGAEAAAVAARRAGVA